MKKLKTKSFIIEYTKENEKDAKRLKKIFDTNEMFFTEFLKPYPVIRLGDSTEPLINEQTLEVENINEFKEILSLLIPHYINQLEIKGDDESLTVFLRTIFTNKYANLDDYKMSIKKKDLPIYIESIYSLIAMDYYETPEELVNALFNLDDKEKKKLTNYLNSKYRRSLLNQLLEGQISFLTETSTEKQQDDFVIENIDELLNHTSQEILSIDLSNQQLVRMPSLTDQELDKSIIEFLIQIDPSLKWLKEYEELKKNNQIKPSDIWNCNQEKGKWVINTSKVHNIEDFRCFIHEFIHYITVKDQKKENLPIAIKEFPSIYFETLAINFLRQKGYPKEATDYMLSERNEWTEENAYDLYLILGLLSNYIKNGEVTIENEVDRRLQIPEDIKRKIPEELSFFYETQEEKINYSFDIANGYILAYPESIYEEYPYITGTYLADRAVEVTNQDPMFIYNMLSITDNLESTNPKDVIDLINQKHKQLTKKHETI